MIVPGLSLDEEARLAALEACAILDTLPEGAFEDLVDLAHRVCAAPVAAISFLDAERQWFKASRGLGGMTAMPRAHAFCDTTIQGNETLVVPDATEDPRFRDNPFVNHADGVRFYAGVPVVTEEGARVGTLCVLDRTPRTLDASQTGMLEMLARQVGAQLALRRTQSELRGALAAQEDATRRLALLVAMQECAAESPDEEAALAGMVACIGHALGMQAGGLWQVPSVGSALMPVGAYWTESDLRAPFAEASRTTMFTRDVGLPGAAWRARATVWLHDLIDEPSLPRMTAALASGLASGVAVPVMLRGEIAAVFELFDARHRVRDNETERLLEMAAGELAAYLAAAGRRVS